jgi:hypothetical protein
MGFVLAKSSGFVDAQTNVRRGEAWADDDPIVLAHPGMFTSEPENEQLLRSSQDAITRPAPVEQATAAPGERRHIDPAATASRARAATGK